VFVLPVFGFLFFVWHLGMNGVTARGNSLVISVLSLFSAYYTHNQSQQSEQ